MRPNCILFLFLTGIVLLNGCFLIPGHGFSESINKKSAGDNLGFEISNNTLCYNWAFKTQRVINNMSKRGDVVDFDLIVDTSDFAEGSKSLKYVIRKCNSTKENMSMYAYYPGFFNEFEAVEGATYRVSFWVKNKDCEFEVLTSAIRVVGGAPCKNQFNNIVSSEDINEWKRFSIEQNICPRMERLRIEVSVKSPGTFQIDGFTIEQLPNK